MSDIFPFSATLSDIGWTILVAAVLGTLVQGISKGGFAGPLSIMSVPIMSFAMPPLQAAAILLPLLIFMDLFALWAHRKYSDWKALSALVPAGIVGVVIGWLLAEIVTSGMIRLIIGLNAVIYVLVYWLTDLKNRPAETHRPVKALGWGTVGGFTSFIAHAGSLPIQMYLLPRKLTPRLMVGISAKYIAIVNIAKLTPYFYLGQFNTENLSISLLMLPVGPLGVWFGLWLVTKINTEQFYRIVYISLFVVGLKLTYDGVVELAGL